ncbi:MAG: hypothetical protein R3F14_44020 [Polyangiaceae bacterium]
MANALAPVKKPSSKVRAGGTGSSAAAKKPSVKKSSAKAALAPLPAIHEDAVRGLDLGEIFDDELDPLAMRVDAGARPPNRYEARPPNRYEARPPNRYEARPPNRYEARPPNRYEARVAPAG